MTDKTEPTTDVEVDPNEPFVYLIGDTAVTFPSMRKMPAGVARRTRHIKDPMDNMWTVIEALFAPDSPELAALDSLDVAGFDAMLSAWQTASGITLGESKAS